MGFAGAGFSGLFFGGRLLPPLARLHKSSTFGRVVDDKDRTDERVLDFFFEDFALDNVRVFSCCDDAEFPSELSDSFAVRDLQTRVFFE